MTIEELIEEYKELPEHCYEVNYSDKNALKKNNDSVKRMYKIIKIITREFGTGGISKLKTLLDIDAYQTNLWAATHLLEKVTLDIETEKKAFGIIEKAASGNDVLALGYQHWIKDWKLKQNK